MSKSSLIVVNCVIPFPNASEIVLNLKLGKWHFNQQIQLLLLFLTLREFMDSSILRHFVSVYIGRS